MVQTVLLVILIYATVVIGVYRRLIPGLGPAFARLPTRLWYDGLFDSETWEIPIPAELAPGAYAVYTGLYRSSDQERLPATNADGGTFVDARIPLGALSLE